MRELHTQETIKLAADLWSSGLSASKVGDKLGMSRNAVIGLSHRNRDLFVRQPAPPIEVKQIERNARHPMSAVGTPKKSGPRPSLFPVLKVTPVPEAIKTSYDAERLVHAKTLIELQPNACKWALTNGKPYLFCAAESNNVSPYCQHHAMRAYQPREKRA